MVETIMYKVTVPKLMNELKGKWKVGCELFAIFALLQGSPSKPLWRHICLARELQQACILVRFRNTIVNWSNCESVSGLKVELCHSWLIPSNLGQRSSCISTSQWMWKHWKLLTKGWKGPHKTAQQCQRQPWSSNTGRNQGPFRIRSKQKHYNQKGR